MKSKSRCRPRRWRNLRVSQKGAIVSFASRWGLGFPARRSLIPGRMARSFADSVLAPAHLCTVHRMPAESKARYALLYTIAIAFRYF